MAANTLFVIAVATSKMIMPGMPEIPNIPGMNTPGFGAPERTLTMTLTSDKPATKASKAECAIPAGLKLGPKVDLKINLPEKVTEEYSIPDEPNDTVDEAGKMVIKYYWMCGETVPVGQPRILDTEKMMADVPKDAKGQVDMSKAMKYAREAIEDSSYAYWPHSGGNPIKDASQHCPGNYTLTTNYCGGTDITFGPAQDFLTPIDLISPKKIDLAQTIQVEWKPVKNALAYILTAFGSKENEMIIWTSAADPDVTTDFTYRAILPDQVKKYIEKGILLPPDKTSCRIPAGIFKDCGAPMLSVIAIGTDKVQTKDNIETQVTVRSTATVMLSAMEGIEDIQAEEYDDYEDVEDSEEAEATKPAKSSSKPAKQADDEASKDESTDASEDADDALDKADKIKDTLNRAKDLLKW